jgi:oligosaccharide repeat unit polymerase
VRGRSTIELGRLFSPLTLVFAIYVPLLTAFLVTSPSLFVSEFRSVKHVTATSVLFYVSALVLFALGALFGRGRRIRRPLREAFEVIAIDDRYRRRLESFHFGLLLVAFASYLAWFASGIVRAGGPTKLVDAWLANPFYVKTQLLRTIPGLTTLTQLAVAAIPLGLAFGLLGRGTRTRRLAIAILLLATARAFVFSERLAILELLVPIVYLALAKRTATVPKAVLLALGLVAAVAVVFTITELRRTYAYTHNASPQRVTARFLGYYLTSIDNGSVVIDRHPAATPFANTGAFLWKFPVLSSFRADYVPGVGTVTLRYADIFGRDPDTYWEPTFVEDDLNYEYNVLSTPGFLAADFGWLALPALLLLGFVSGTLYTRAATSPFHRALYAVWLIGLLEFMRIMYFFDTRAFPAYVAFAAVYVSIARRAPVARRVTPASYASVPARGH